jgi:hypothetical protein
MNDGCGNNDRLQHSEHVALDARCGRRDPYSAGTDGLPDMEWLTAARRSTWRIDES